MLIPHNPITNSLFGWFLGVKMSKLDTILEGYKWVTLPPPAILLHNSQITEGEVFLFSVNANPMHLNWCVCPEAFCPITCCLHKQ